MNFTIIRKPWTEVDSVAFLISFSYSIYYTVENDRIIVHAVLPAKRSTKI